MYRRYKQNNTQWENNLFNYSIVRRHNIAREQRIIELNIKQVEKFQ